jgi:hypothetical protein
LIDEPGRALPNVSFPVISIGCGGGLSAVATPGNLRTREIESAPPIKSSPVKTISRSENRDCDIPNVQLAWEKATEMRQSGRDVS